MPYPDKFYPVVDSVKWVAQLAALGVGTIQLRAKDLNDAEMKLLKHEARALFRKDGSWKPDLLAEVRKAAGNSKLAKSAGQS